uniref:Uncharacterized protein n=1 Tax=Raoultella planticola TaxID=575 RepID=W8CU04_RAOPL|nr:hypothetical protein pKpNDM1_00296 [Raoultella planticola]UHA82525.1 hypothetical protein NNFBJPFD_00271 [Enterobacter cloacae]UQW93936.1 hypothetical protein OKNFBMNL_00083 [Klebsiella quasipneumoniae subsp. quasipneumoniae]UQW94259.1 hypothetical protein PCIJMNHK_00028 [Klebsiella variicola]UWX38422.1 hypothetical protein KK467_p0570 [Klebsiella pneumoniae]
MMVCASFGIKVSNDIREKIDDLTRGTKMQIVLYNICE